MISLRDVLIILSVLLALLDLIAMIVCQPFTIIQIKLIFSVMLLLRNINASVCNANFRYSIPFGCDRGVHCVGCIADHLYYGPDSCKLQVRIHDTFPKLIYTNIPFV